MDLAEPGGKGIYLKVGESQKGTVNIILEKVHVSGSAYHGIHISDCVLRDKCGGGMGGGGDGSPASISAHLANVKIESVGYGAFDGDGIWIDECGEGSIYTTVIDSLFSRVGADGIELDEGNKGDVTAQIIRSRFVDTGNYCDPTVLKKCISKRQSEEELRN
ncbi:hypothetical protein ACJJIP_18755 [Microbulbifer sp. VTAC004]|uniref:hypothetical protein n=1 Tax=Microbulbifer sp. VTAC004 TaxID=3243386 RepID=UPI00403956D2